MRLRGSSRPVRCGAGTLVVLAAVVLGSPSRSFAGCSSYVVPGTSHSGATLADLVHPAGDVAVPLAPYKPAKPCDGPSCSGRPAAPATSPVVPRPHRAELWGYLATVAPRDEAKGRLLPPSEARPCADRHGLRIDRPPRPSVHPCA